jgi:glycerol-3-phosphate acyltransferase PlsX
MTDSIRLSIDAMGGDHGPAVCVPASLEALSLYPQLSIQLVGREEGIVPYLERVLPHQLERIEIVAASEVVAMDESPRDALRKKKDSSMRVAVNRVKEGLADACVSAGNTGALMGTGHFVLGCIDGIDRAAILSAMPTFAGQSWMLDLGANSQATPEQLLQFAVMGDIVASGCGVERPKVGLLNIGHEDIKGTPLVKTAHELLSTQSFNYIGFVEGDQILGGEVDVVVTDGFTGNVALKSMEGLAKMIMGVLKEEFTRHPLRQMAALTAMAPLNAVKERLDPRRYNGAVFVGLNGVLVKSHGGADEVAFTYAIHEAITQVKAKVPQQIKGRLAGSMTQDVT